MNGFEALRTPEKLSDPGHETPPENRDWTLSQAYHKMNGWLFPYVRSRVLPGEFHPIIAYLFVEYTPQNRLPRRAVFAPPFFAFGH